MPAIMSEPSRAEPSRAERRDGKHALALEMFGPFHVSSLTRPPRELGAGSEPGGAGAAAVAAAVLRPTLPGMLQLWYSCAPAGSSRLQQAPGGPVLFRQSLFEDGHCYSLSSAVYLPRRALLFHGANC